jgi:hypothetical protein
MTEHIFRVLVLGLLLFHLVLSFVNFWLLEQSTGVVINMVRNLHWKLFPEDKKKYEEWSRETDEVFGK